MSAARWAIGFVTLERPLAAQRFVRSARREFPGVPIFVADQSRSMEPMAEFYAAEEVTVVRVPFDAGLSASRNALVEAMDVEYLALCDDDFILGPATEFAAAIRVLEDDPQLGVVGGLLHDFDGSTERIRNWEMYFDLDASRRRFTAIPIYSYPPELRHVAGETVYACDAVLNFAVFRMAMFASGVRWDERIRINGEHEDFYLQLKQQASWKVAFLPAMTALHWHVAQPGEYSDLRARPAGRQEFLSKWQLRAHLELGSGSHPLDGTPVHDWFATTSAEPARDPAAGIDNRLLYVEPASQEAGPRPATSAPAGCLDWADPERVTATGAVPVDLVFCYSPDVEQDGVLQLWYRTVQDSHQGPDGQADTAGVVVRWYTAQGCVLVWESEEIVVRGGEQRYWQPLTVPLPLWPRQTTYLRFEVHAAGARRELLATGFVFPDIAPLPDRSAAPQVLAWCRPTAPVLREEAAQLPLAEHLRLAPRASVDPGRPGGQAWTSIDVSGLDFLGLVSRDATVPALLLGAGDRASGFSTAPLALPLDLLQDPDSVLFAVTSSQDKEPIRILEPRLAEAVAG